MTVNEKKDRLNHVFYYININKCSGTNLNGFANVAEPYGQEK